MELKPLTLEDRERFESFLAARGHALSPYAFPAIYGWKGLYEITWAQVSSSLCVFFTDSFGTFLYLPPLGGGVDGDVVEECFREMGRRNRNPGLSRIENVEEADLGAFRALGYAPVFKSHDYVYSRAALSGLRGDAFKSKRALVNHFTKHYRHECVPYVPGRRGECIRLYREWMSARAGKNSESVYCGMLSDSLTCLERVLEDAPGLGVSGLVVTVDGAVKGFTLGYPLNGETFCVFFEVCDLSYKGLSQFIFRRFCAEAGAFRLINAMDDSGLKNLERVKSSYRPLSRVPAYIVNRREER